MIKLEKVGMKFNLGIEKNNSFKETFIRFFQFKDKKNKKKQNDYFWALKDVSFEVKAGESWGFVGMNGSGKSTLLKTVCGILKPFKGSVSVHGTISPLISLLLF